METKKYKEYKVSVIIPVYNVRDYIARCAESLMNQTLREVEFIFVDDASPDDSISILHTILKRFPQRQSDIIHITHKKNKGLPAARNAGLNAASGEYIFHCDSDDYVESTMLQEMYEYAIISQADIVWSDWYLSLSKTERYMSMPDYQTTKHAIKSMLSGGMKYNVWNKLAKRSLYLDNHVSFPSGYGMGEDLTMIKLFAYANKVTHLSKAFYHYNKTNIAAFSQTYSDRHMIELRHNIEDLSEFILDKSDKDYMLEVAFLKLEAKFPLLLSPDRRRIKEWKSWFPEANRFIKHNRYISINSRFLQQLAAWNFWFPVRLYNFMFNRILYGFIYK